MINKLKLAQAELFGEGIFNFEDKYSKISITHTPVMITDNNKILCIPNDKELFHIGVTGATGKGKGIVGNNLLGWEYWLRKLHCVILNDFQRETFEQSLPCLNKIFQENLKIINAKATPLPIVYVYPSNKHLQIDDIEKIIRKVNYHKTKAKNIIGTARILSGHRIPRTTKELVALPGVGRKVANVYLAEAYKADVIGVDTHVKKISFKLGWTKNKNPDKIEKDLMKLFPKKYWGQINNVLVKFGRGIGKSIIRDDDVLSSLR